MSKYVRDAGEVIPSLPADAPLALRLPAEVYALDGSDYLVAPGARLEVSKKGKLYETLGDFPGGSKGMLLAAAGIGAAWWFLRRKK